MDITTMRLEGHVRASEVKELLVESARTGCCEYVHLKTTNDSWTRKELIDIFADDDTHGVEVTLWFTAKEREKESKPRMSDNPSIEKFVKKYDGKLFLAN
jgi:hypothetical protein